MRTLSLIAAGCLLLAAPASAQMNYTFKASTAAYAPLSGATSVTGGKLWRSENSFALPLGFSFKVNGVTTQTMYLSGSLLHPPMQSGKQSGFMLLSTGLMDRGTIQGTPKSDIRYTTTGAAGSRIFKLELFNAGFEDEHDNNGELKDSANMQIWLYEGSNAVEFRFGGSDVANFSDYFTNGRMLSGIIRNFDTATAAFEKLHFLNGAPAAPAMDSTTSLLMTKGLSAFPANGQVYRFGPKGASTAIEYVAPRSLATVFPTRCSGTLQLRNSGKTTLRGEILGVDGRLSRQLECAPGQHSLDLSTLSPGIYILRLTDPADGHTEIQRIEKI